MAGSSHLAQRSSCVVVPRDADLAAGCARRRSPLADAPALGAVLAAAVRTCGQDDRGRCHEPGQLCGSSALSFSSNGSTMTVTVWNPPALGYHPPLPWDATSRCDTGCTSGSRGPQLIGASRGPIQAAGSARNGSNASSAAPSSGASSARADGTTRTSGPRRRERAPVELRLHAADDERVHPPEPAAEDDEPRVEDVDEAGQPRGRASDRRGRGRRGPSRTRRAASTQDRVDLGAAAAHRMTGPEQQGVLADLGLPAADRAAAAGRPARVDRHVPDLAAVAGGAGQRPAIDDEPAADPDLARDEQDVVGADRRAAAVLGERRRGRPRWRSRSARCSPSARASRSPSGTSRQPRFGAIETSPSLRRTTPTTATPTPISGSSAGRRARIVGGQADDRRDDLVDRRHGRGAGRPGSGRGPRRRARRSRRRASRPRCRGRGRRPRSGSSRTSGDGRPGVPRGIAGPSVTRPAATSSPIRPRIALRVRPVWATRSERDRGPRTCSSRTIALRFARRTVSLRWPSSSRPIVTGFVFLSSKPCDRLVHAASPPSRSGSESRRRMMGPTTDRALDGGDRAMTEPAMGDPVDRGHRSHARSSRACSRRSAARSWPSRSRDAAAARRVADELGIAPGARLVRGAARRP